MPASSTPELSAPELQRFTTRYIEREDRIQITGASRDGQVHTLWLTQRLLSRLLPHLFKWLDTQVTMSQHTNDQAPSSPLNAEQVTQQQRTAQLKATAEQKPQTAVENIDNATQWLVTAVDIRSGNHGLRLVLKADTSAAASLTLSSTAARQWLKVVHNHYQRANWPTDNWPQWINAESTATTPSNRILH